MRAVVCLFFFASNLLIQAESVNVYFGTRGHSAEGIYRAELDKLSGKLSSIQLAAEARIPAFLALHPTKKILYAITGDRENATVTSFTIQEDGGLMQLNQVKGADGRSAHIAVHPSGLFLMTAQYGGGSVALYPLKEDGSLEPCKQKVEHQGASGVVKNRQQGPHPHWVGFSPDARFAFVPDLGLDQIIIYRINTSELTIEQVGAAQSVPGGGPRHMRFSVNGKFIYLLNELELSVTTFAYDEETGSTERLTTTKALSEEQKANESFNSASEILVHPNGLFVYTGNRGHDSVTVYQADPKTGKLEVVEVEPIRGSWPRNINMDTSGRWLLAAGANSNTLSVFEVDPETGELTFPRGAVYNIPEVICILFDE